MPKINKPPQSPPLCTPADTALTPTDRDVSIKTKMMAKRAGKESRACFPST